MTSVFSAMNSVTPGCLLRSNRTLSVPPKYQTQCYRFHCRKNILPLVSEFFLIQLHSMNLVLDQHPTQLAALFCDSRTKPIMKKIQKNPSWKLMSKGERETITSKLNHIYRRSEYSREERDPKCLVFKRREVTCLQEGKDMFIFARLH